MARTAIPVTASNKSGITLAFATSDQVNGNAFQNDGHSVLVIRNSSGSALTVTLRTTRIEDGDAITGLKLPDRVVTVPANTGGLMVGTFPMDI